MLLTLLAAHLPHLELGERPVGGLVQVRQCQSVSLVWSEALHPPQHPVVVLRLLGLCDMLGGPGTVPGGPALVLPHAHTGVGLQVKQG